MTNRVTPIDDNSSNEVKKLNQEIVKMNNIELQKKLVRLQDQQRKAEDAGNMEKADRLYRKIEKLYGN